MVKKTKVDATFNNIKDVLRYMGKHKNKIIILDEGSMLNFDKNKHRLEIAKFFKKIKKKCECGHDVAQHNNTSGCMHVDGNEKEGYIYCDCRIKHDAFEVEHE